MIRLADAMRRARYAVAAAWLIAAVLSLAAVTGAFGTTLNDLLSNRFDLPGTESEQSLALLTDHFGQRSDSGYTLVFSGRHRACRPGRRRCSGRPRVVPDARIGPLQPAGPGVSFAQIDTRLEPQPAALRVEPMRRAVGTVSGGRVYVSGQVAINHDLQPVFDADLQRGEEIAIPIAVLVLLIVFGTATATLVPLLMAAGTVPGHARPAVDRRPRDEHGDLRDQSRHADRHRDRDRLLAARRLPLPRGARGRRRRAGGAAHHDAHGGTRGALLRRDGGDRARLPRAHPAAVHPLDGRRRPAHPARLDLRRDDAAARAAGRSSARACCGCACR